MQFIVLEPTKIAGEVRKPNEIVDDELLSEKQIEQLFAANLIAGYEETVPVMDPASPSGPNGSEGEKGAAPTTSATKAPAKAATKAVKRRA